MHMIIRPSDGKGLQALFASGRFAEADGAFVIDKLGGAAPVGGMLCSLGSEYSVQMAPDGTGRSLFGPLDITPMSGTGKACYIRDLESGEVWSIAFSPLGERNTDYQISYLPGQATIHSLNNKIAAELTVAVLPDRACEVWRIRLENRSAADRVLAITTYAEPAIGSGVETKYFEEEHALIARKSLQAHQPGSGRTSRDLVLFHSCTIAPTAYETEKNAFIGDGSTLRNPRKLDQGGAEGRDGLVEEAILSFTANVDLPIEGEAEVGFCFGAVDSVEAAVDSARSVGRISRLRDALASSVEHWRELCSTLTVHTPDPALNALVNLWLPYEAYAGWISQRTGGVVFDSSQVVDGLRRYYAIAAAAPEVARDNLTDFASRMCATGTYVPTDDVQIVPSAEDMLWLAASAASYVSETGDLGALDLQTRGGDSITTSLREECERAIRMCLNAEKPCEDMGLLERTVELWVRIYPEAADLADKLATVLKGRDCEDDDLPDDRTLSRRLSYLQSVCPTLADPAVLDQLRVAQSGSESSTRETCILYCALVERLFGVSASVDGLVVRPWLPDSWPGFEMTRRLRGDTYNICVRRSKASRPGMSMIVDGEPLLSDMVPYFHDGGEHVVEVIVS